MDCVVGEGIHFIRARHSSEADLGEVIVGAISAAVALDADQRSEQYKIRRDVGIGNGEVEVALPTGPAMSVPLVWPVNVNVQRADAHKVMVITSAVLVGLAPGSFAFHATVPNQPLAFAAMFSQSSVPSE